MNARWHNYFLSKGAELHSFWQSYLNSRDRDVLFVLGLGFDPRALDCFNQITSFGGAGRRHVVGIRYFATEEESNGTRINPSVQNHIANLDQTLTTLNQGACQIKRVILRSGDDKHIASINATQLFSSQDISGYSDVIVDISAMPRGIFIPLINKLLTLIDDSGGTVNLHVVVTENAKLDSNIQDRGSAEEATFIYGFGVPDQALNKDQKMVWIPILGESQTEQFDLIRKSINPVETCIVLPFPSMNLRRGDEIVEQYMDLLFNDPNFDPRNIVYVFENNPFNVYRLLTQTIARYREAFEMLDGCKIIVSALSSKLLTVGAFLAVYEAKKKNNQDIGIKQVESMSHKIEDQVLPEIDRILEENTLVHLWLTGEPYLSSLNS
jgi:hypothetical protein